jgi:hypothetical protein
MVSQTGEKVSPLDFISTLFFTSLGFSETIAKGMG